MDANKRLLDDWRISGKLLFTFTEEIKKLSAHTYKVNVTPNQIELFSISSINKKYLTGYLVTPDYINEPKERFPQKAKHKINENIRSVYDETILAGYMPIVDGKLCHASKWMIGRLARFAGVGGSDIAVPSLFRDMHIVYGLGWRQDAIELRSGSIGIIVREYDGVRKAFVAVGTSHTQIPIMILCETARMLTVQGGIVRSWEITQKTQSIAVEFPELEWGDVIPGVELSSSDLAFSSLIIRGTIRNKNVDVPAYCAEYSISQCRANIGYTAKRLLDDIEDEVYPKIKTSMERMKNACEYTDDPCGLIKERLDEISSLNRSDEKMLCKWTAERFKDQKTVRHSEVIKTLIAIPGACEYNSRAKLQIQKNCGAF